MSRAKHPHIRILAQKHLGQNFLVNDIIKDRIIDSCNLQATDTIMEIGPGQGALTQGIIKNVANFYAIEKDIRFIDTLKAQFPQAHIIQADILKYDFKKLPQNFKVIGNLPFNISSPIIEKLIYHRQNIHDAFLTVQLEFGERLTAKPNRKDYGSLSCFIQYYADIEILFKIPRWAFRPIPKVTSCFLHLTFREPQLKATDEKLLFRIIQTAFRQRRKKISNALLSIIPKEKLTDILEKLKLNQTLRAENLTLQNYVDISNELNTRGER
ncbi:MAG: ribosomal RNA small subunit methyltransferase A [Candidatus Omnitrophica bacterium]|nr:ribosomal RNA small subunit methyltransferase A [Candidatus Omnitrophota bacterium]